MTLSSFEDDFLPATIAADGTATLTWNGLRGTWGSLLVIGQTLGVPRWTLLKQGSPVGVGRGPNAPIQFPPIVDPGTRYTLAVTGGQAGATATAHISGVHSDVSALELPRVAPMPGTIALDIVSPLLLSDRIDTAAGTGSKSYPMLIGAETIMVTIDLGNASRSINPTLLVAKCFPSDFSAIAASGAVLNVNPRQLGLLNPTDTAFDVEWTMAGANAANCFLDVSVFATNLLSPQNVAFQFDTNQNLLVSMAASQPAIWQAPNSAAYVELATVSGTSHVIAATGGKTIHLHTIQLGTDVAAAGGVVYKLQNSSGGTVVGGGRSVNIVNNGNFIDVEYWGFPLPLGDGLDVVFVAGTAANVRGTVTYSLI